LVPVVLVAVEGIQLREISLAAVVVQVGLYSLVAFTLLIWFFH
jgi:hypothetical protein